jgi:hypothetical protein
MIDKLISIYSRSIIERMYKDGPISRSGLIDKAEDLKPKVTVALNDLPESFTRVMPDKGETQNYKTLLIILTLVTRLATKSWITCLALTQSFMGSCSHHVRLMYGSCTAHVRLMYNSCTTHVRLMYVSCTTHDAEFMVS